METTNAIPSSIAHSAPRAPAQQPMGGAPWLAEANPPAIAPRRLPRRVVPVGRRNRTVEVLHWGVVVLTLITTASILLGSRAEGAQPRELLPIMIVSPAR